MNKIKLPIVLFLMAFPVLGTYAQESQHQKGTWDRFQVEIFGGFAFMNPVDLNLRPEYDQQYLINQREFYSYYSSSSQPNLSIDEFRKVKGSLPFGLRLRYSPSHAISLSLGFRYFSSNQTSNVSAQFLQSGESPYILDFEYSPYAISTQGFSPLIGIHYSFGKTNSLNFEVFLSGGPLFAECSYLIGIARLYSRNSQVFRANETSYEIKGKSTGLALMAGSRVNFSILRKFKMFCEAGYSYQTAKDVYGQGNLIYNRYLDPNRIEVADEINWEGYWGIKEAQGSPPFPSNEWEKNDSRVRAFKLSLSGLFIHIGISFKFSL